MSKEFAYGVDVGWMTQLEKKGIIWKDINGKQVDPLLELKQMGATAARLRVFVNPPIDGYWFKYVKKYNGGDFGGVDCMLGYCDKQSILETAKRIQSMGMDLMIDFHYSDHFADNIYQDIPEVWEKLEYEDIAEKVKEHTLDVLKLLKVHNIEVKWIQIGNEIDNGMLFPIGSALEQPDQFVSFLNIGYKAAKDIFPSSKVITHISCGHDYKKCESFFKFFFNHGGKTDIMGFSYYPEWIKMPHDKEKLKNDMTNLVKKFKKPMMLCEIGGREDKEDESYNLLKSSIQAIKEIPDCYGVGIFYWEPEVGSDFLPDNYPLGAARALDDKYIQFTKAMNAYADSKRKENVYEK